MGASGIDQHPRLAFGFACRLALGFAIGPCAGFRSCFALAFGFGLAARLRPCLFLAFGVGVWQMFLGFRNKDGVVMGRLGLIDIRSSWAGRVSGAVGGPVGLLWIQRVRLTLSGPGHFPLRGMLVG